MSQWFYLDVNPDPWAIGPIGVGRRNGKMYPYVGQNAQLAAYKETVVDQLKDAVPLGPGEYVLTFYFWRRLDSHESGKKHQADATNLQKSTEDALQGVLIGNDRNVRDIRSVIVEQSSETKPCIVIRADIWDGYDDSEIPDEIWDKIDQVDAPQLFDNEWTGPA